MSYERFYDRFDENVDPGFYPEHDPEDDVTKENPCELLLGNKAVYVVKQTVKRMQSPISNGSAIGLGLESLKWTTNCISEGLKELIIVIPDNNIALRINSPIIDATASNDRTAVDQFIEDYQKRMSQVNARDLTSYPIPVDITETFLEIEEKMRVESFQIIGSHSVALFDTITHMMSVGNGVAAIDRRTNEMELFPEEIYPSKISTTEFVQTFKKIKKIMDMPPLVDPIA